MSVSWDGSGLYALAADLGKASAQVTQRASQAVRKAAMDVEAAAKRGAPVDTGALRNSISTDTPTVLSAEIGPTVNYGLYVEMGTSRMAAQPYMGPALAQIEPGFTAAIAQLGGDLLQ